MSGSDVMTSTKEAAETIKDTQQDIRALRNDLSLLMKQVAALIGETRDDATDDVKARLQRLSERGRETLTQATDSVVESLDESLRNHPITTLAIAVGLGFIFGSISTRR